VEITKFRRHFAEKPFSIKTYPERCATFIALPFRRPVFLNTNK